MLKFFSGYISSLRDFIPLYIFISLPVICAPALFLGRSIRFYLALVSLLLMFLLIYAAVAGVRRRNWKMAVISIAISSLLSIGAGALLGVAIKLVLFALYVLFTLLIFAAIWSSPVWVAGSGSVILLIFVCFTTYKILDSSLDATKKSALLKSEPIHVSNMKT